MTLEEEIDIIVRKIKVVKRESKRKEGINKNLIGSPGVIHIKTKIKEYYIRLVSTCK